MHARSHASIIPLPRVRFARLRVGCAVSRASPRDRDESSAGGRGRFRRYAQEYPDITAERPDRIPPRSPRGYPGDARRAGGEGWPSRPLDNASRCGGFGFGAERLDCGASAPAASCVYRCSAAALAGYFERGGRWGQVNGELGGRHDIRHGTRPPMRGTPDPRCGCSRSSRSGDRCLVGAPRSAVDWRAVHSGYVVPRLAPMRTMPGGRRD